MAGSFLWLCVLSLGMLFGAFFAGQIPLSMSLSGERLRLLNTLGAGLTVGAALIVIIPEGVETLYTAQQTSPTTTVTIHKRALVEHSFVGRCSGPDCAKVVERFARAADVDELWGSDNPVLEDSKRGDSESNGEDGGRVPDGTTGNHTDDDHHHGGHGDFAAHTYIGPSLALGFAVILLIDQLFKARHTPEHHIITLSDFRARPPTPTSSQANGSHSHRSNAFAATLGMVVHAAADGVALGASSAVSTSLEFVVFLAIIVHKAPSAFGLATHLLNEGFGRRAVRQHLLAFSLSAPFAAILTYLFLLGGDAGFGFTEPFGPMEVQKWTGVLLLFSGGTFLFVSLVHILPEVYTPETAHGNASPLMADEKHSHGTGKLTSLQIILLLIGIGIPWALHISH
ncbi:Zinc/iron permease [Gonapodya prolifera JEL478]|uniref:Zinc/iron permease n=1 Tax=Gonapodya prolifera (strain JEL478) TaxID=1344416 RepID=A0A138ZZN7_GONPJ|nr:Zinc/iron permease [Gonapodya prolifera JEL478]|eukprot:KXS09735.1 Zinc/iron permease [Gonapodya prolifera JEL478]